uniref:Putative Clavaminate synthase-like protein n=1 Tax=Moniliophthora roreri TaxID=221103 RepID=A0A0W0F2Y9_MONRR
MPSLAPGNFSSIPILDFALTKDPETKPVFISQLQNALINVGFLYLSNTQIDIEELKGYIPKLFDLPQETKEKILMRNSPHFLGYNGLGAELTKGKIDYREQFDFATTFASRWKEGDPEYFRLWGPSQYPDEQEIPGFRLARDGLAKFAGSDEEMLHFSKIVKYPVPRAENLSSQGVGAHVDPGFVTILLQASDHPGLQVQNLVGDWIDVPPIPGTFVVNFGRALEYVTQGIVRATSHRVLSPPLDSTTPRYSVPYFHNLSLDVRLSDPQHCIQFSKEVLRLRDIRGKLPETDASNYKEMTTETFGMASLIGRIKSHPDVGAVHYPDLFSKLFPNGLPEHLHN